MLCFRMSLAHISPCFARSPFPSARTRNLVPSRISSCNLLRLADPSCNSQLQLDAFPRSVDSRRLTLNLSPFRINTSKVSEVLIMEDLCRA